MIGWSGVRFPAKSIFPTDRVSFWLTRRRPTRNQVTVAVRGSAAAGLSRDRDPVITQVPFGSGIAEPTCTIAAQFGEPEATRTLFQRVAMPRRQETSQVDSWCNKAIHRGPR